MKRNKHSFKDDLACNIALICVLVFTAVHLLFITLDLFDAKSFNFAENFNFVTAYILVIISLALFIFGFFTYKFTKLYLPSWFRIMFYVAFFLFTNTYYACGWYNCTLGLIAFFAYFAFLISIISLSVYFNIQKDNKNKLKVEKNHLLCNVYFYGIAICSIFQFLVCAVKVLFFKEYVFATLSIYVIEFLTMLAVQTIMLLLFNLSLKTSKKFINACLIKVNNNNK